MKFREPLRRANELKRVGKSLKGTPLATTLMEGGGQLPWLPPEDIFGYGFQMMAWRTPPGTRGRWPFPVFTDPRSWSILHI